jgi:hypothetical protein
LLTRQQNLTCSAAVDESQHPIAQSSLKNALHGTYLQIWTFPVGALCFHLKSRTPQSEYTMNIFYIIGVIVVVLFVAGFFGLHA